MKSFIVLAVVISVVAFAQAMSEEEKKAVEIQLMGECKTKEGASDADIQSLTSREHPSTHSGKCLSACIMETIGVVKDNKVSVEGAVNIAKMLHPGNDQAVQIATNIATDCLSLTDADRCEFAAKYMKCSEESAVKNGLDPKKML